ncbi:hypothetical protein FB558_3101 [Pseudonocardia kunmingensis]|uniref:Uncharacterized protein n=1 Tax=Pseudonocardia kunmingensis TaxID=630975 RepID=A0A543E3Y8_9PSEU|nr:hypothetical protein FB558_3101 [Pseudonocardia kunmingensis]
MTPGPTEVGVSLTMRLGAIRLLRYRDSISHSSDVQGERQ